MLFREFIRSDGAPKRATESDFAFIERCSWPTTKKIRALFEACLVNYPEEEKAELISRLQSGTLHQFTSGSFELFLHEYLLKLGFGLKAHPELSNGSMKRPDFLVTTPSGEQLYVEAVCTSDNDGRNTSAETRKAVALEVLDDAYHPNFMVTVNSTGEPATQPSGKKLTREVILWLNSLDADHLIAQAVGNYNALPEYHWEHEDWQVSLRAIPVKTEFRGAHRRLIGMRGLEGGFIDAWTPIRDAIIKKTQRYGKLELPLVVAVNVDTFNLDPIDESQALFGQEEYVFNPNVSNSEPQFTRAPNGAWFDLSGPKRKRCSGAWMFSNLSPYTLARARHTLYLNPWANQSIPNGFLRMPHAQVLEEKIRMFEGLTLRDAFQLEEQWPE